MNMHPSWILGLFGTTAFGLVGCGLLEGDSAAVNRVAPDTEAAQSVVLQPVFLLEGLDDLPTDIHLDELHLGVGSLFFEPTDRSLGSLAYANHEPFSLHFRVASGEILAYGPAMVLPEGGRYQVSVELEPQSLDGGDPSSVGQLGGDDEASLSVSGTITEANFAVDGMEDEPQPILLTPKIEEFGRLSSSVQSIPFSYSSRETRRFILDEIDLANGANHELVLRLQVGEWIDETLAPALDIEIVETYDPENESDEGDPASIDLSERIDETGDGLDGLVGGMDVELR